MKRILNRHNVKVYSKTFPMNCNFSVTFIKSLNQSSIEPCLIVHLVAMRTLKSQSLSSNSLESFRTQPVNELVVTPGMIFLWIHWSFAG